MKKKTTTGFKVNQFLLTTSLILAGVTTAMACTRVVYLGEEEQIITARSMDWKMDIETNLWAFPRGVERVGEAGPNSIKWKSKYGSVIASGYDIATTDGLNEKGLAANLLWLVESEYPEFKQDSKPGLSVALWAQYVLDNYASVKEAVEALEKEPFTLVTDSIPGQDRLATVHLSMSDASGDSAIIEYIDGKQVIHHNRSYQVMTNSPVFSEQIALNEYWKQIGGTVMLPGTNRAADRFVRASFYVDAIPKKAPIRESLASMFGVIRNASVPYGISSETEPNISSTRWRTVTDHKNLNYFFESALSPNTFWVDLKKMNFDFDPDKAMKLDLGKQESKVYAGEVSASFVETKPFAFLGLK
ncbi:MAG: linear amide C-N hydrolase [Alcaligenaceae bacterium]|nr:linear amide C-N hydrolase [Alcaligenaceae bacterium]